MLRKPLLLAVLLPLAAAAHDPLPHQNWCANGTVAQVGRFNYDGGALARAAAAYVEACDKNCGEFDAYAKTMNLLGSVCDAFEIGHRLGPGDFNDVIPLVEAPASYRAENHHRSFSLDQGVSGICVRCVAPRAYDPGRER